MTASGRGRSILSHTIVLVVCTVVAMQLVAVGLLLGLEAPQARVTLRDVTAAAEGTVPRASSSGLDVRRLREPPAGWEVDIPPMEAALRGDIARRLETSRSAVRVEWRQPFPGASRLIWRREARARGEAVAEHDPVPDEFPMDEYDVAVRAESGQWILLSPHRPLLPRFAWIMLAWTGATVLVLAPLIYLFRRQLVRPVVELASMAARVSEGGSVDRPPASGPLELRVAADALWEMHLRLDEHIAHQARLLAGMAHDLRTPLTRMHFRLEEALGDEAAPLIRDIEYMDSIIGRALALVRGDDRAAFSEVRLDVLLESVVDDFASAGARVAVTVNGPVRVLGDSLALRRLFSNLLANGVKYGGSVACSLYVEGETAVTVIDDDGPGLAPDVLDRAYEPFFGVRTADGVPPGAGLGLAIVRSVVQSHGGRIALANRTEGGLQATVWLNVLP